jgi:RimJ/RimL family protein N-acetyltransferase
VARSVYLRTASEKDIDFILSVENMPENVRYLGHWIGEDYRAALTDPDVMVFVIEESGTRQGFAVLSGLSEPDYSICLYRIAVVRKGRGLGTESVKQIITYCFEQLTAARLWLDVKIFNTRAENLYIKLGFRYVGTLLHHVWSTDEQSEVKVYSLAAEDYPKLPWRK